MTSILGVESGSWLGDFENYEEADALRIHIFLVVQSVSKKLTNAERRERAKQKKVQIITILTCQNDSTSCICNLFHKFILVE